MRRASPGRSDDQRRDRHWAAALLLAGDGMVED
jgi:hypothetical protein